MSQDFSEKGRIEWAIHSYGEGKAALEREDFDTAIATLKESVTTFPFPRTLELLGECLLLENRPAEATLYLAAAVGIAKDYQFRPLFLLGKALATAGDTYVAKIKLEQALSINPDKEAQDLLNEVVSKAEAKAAMERKEAAKQIVELIGGEFEQALHALQSLHEEFEGMKLLADDEKVCTEQLQPILEKITEINNGIRGLSIIMRESFAGMSGAGSAPPA